MEEVKVSVDGKTAELIIRHGEAKKVYDQVEVIISGCIDSVSRFLKNRIASIQVWEGEITSHILVDNEKGEILLIVAEAEHFGTQIQGLIVAHPYITKFGVNSGEYMSPEKMANHLKARKHLFDSQSEYALVYTALKAFKAKVGLEINAIKDDRGGSEFKRIQAVEHNIPASFKLKVSLFKGTHPVEVPVEFMVNDSLDVALSSTDLIQLTDETRDRMIEDEVKAIEAITKDIVIINV